MPLRTARSVLKHNTALREFVTAMNVHPMAVIVAICFVYVVLGMAMESLSMITGFYETFRFAGVKPLTAGGDHLITLPILRALAKDGPVGLIQFDANSDKNDSYFGGHKYTHGTWVRRAIEEGLIDPKRCVQIGIRGSRYAPDGTDFAEKAGVTTLGMSVAGGVLRLRPQRTRPSIMTMPMPGMSPSCTLSSRSLPAVCWALSMNTKSAARPTSIRPQFRPRMRAVLPVAKQNTSSGGMLPRLDSSAIMRSSFNSGALKDTSFSRFMMSRANVPAAACCAVP